MRERVHRVTLQLLSLHGLPKRREQRPRFEGAHSGCHAACPELSGQLTMPDLDPVSNPRVSVELYPLAGFASVSLELPPRHVTPKCSTTNLCSNGFNARIAETVYCLAAEPNETLMRVVVTDAGREVAYETAVLGAVKGGYRCFHLRSRLGTRIENCYLFAYISLGNEPNLWASSAEMRRKVEDLQFQNQRLIREGEEKTAQIERLRQRLHAQRGSDARRGSDRVEGRRGSEARFGSDTGTSSRSECDSRLTPTRENTDGPPVDDTMGFGSLNRISDPRDSLRDLPGAAEMAARPSSRLSAEARAVRFAESSTESAASSPAPPRLPRGAKPQPLLLMRV
eukprot:652973-Pleurochrysis_carterae.AAC.3